MRLLPLTKVTVGTKAGFSFKDPFDNYIRDMLKVESGEIMLEVTSVLSMVDHIKLSHRDPYTDVYKNVGINEIDYKKDLDDNIHLITFMYLDEYNSERIFRVPLTYILDVSDPSSIAYVNHGIYISTEEMPLDTDLSFLNKDLTEFIKGRLGVNVELTFLVNDDLRYKTSLESEKLETVRRNKASVRKTLETRAREAEEDLRAIKERLRVMGIQLWE